MSEVNARPADSTFPDKNLGEKIRMYREKSYAY